MWLTDLVVLAQDVAPPVAPAEPVHESNISVGVATILFTLFLAVILLFINKVLHFRTKWDNAILLFVVLFGVVGVIAQTPPGQATIRLISSFWEAGAAEGGLSTTWSAVIGVLLVLTGIYAFFTNPGLLSLFWLLITTIALFSTPIMAEVTDLYMRFANVGYHWMIGAFGSVYDSFRT